MPAWTMCESFGGVIFCGQPFTNRNHLIAIDEQRPERSISAVSEQLEGVHGIRMVYSAVPRMDVRRSMRLRIRI